MERIYRKNTCIIALSTSPVLLNERVCTGNAEGRYALSEGHHEIPVEPRQREREVKDERGKTAHDEMKAPMMVFPSVTGTIKSGVHRKKKHRFTYEFASCRLSA